jgi:VWFA-related protein
MRGKSRRVAWILLLLLATSGVMSAQLAPVYQVVVGLDPVAIDVAVTDGLGRAAIDLRREDFLIYEDGEPQEVLDVEPVGMPYSILLMVDRSAREEKSKWPEFVVNSVDLFLKNLRGPDRLAVAAFDERVAVLVDWRRSRNGIGQKVMLRKSDQHTRFFEAINWASEEMSYFANGATQAQPLSKGRKGVIVFTDGRDFDMYPRLVDKNIPDPLYEVPERVDQRFEKARRTLQQGRVPFYFVAVDTDRQLSEKSAAAKFEGWARFLKEVRTRMEQLASASGGSAAFPKRIDDLVPFYNRIHRDLGTGYHITYHPRRPPDGKLRNVEVRVRNSDLRVYQSNSTYYPR